MKIKSSLRIKLTLVTVIIMSVMCVLLTYISQRASRGIITALQVLPANSSQGMSSETYSEDASLAQSASLDVTWASVPATLVQAQDDFNITTFASMLLIVLLGGGVVYVCVKHELSPLERLVRQVQEIDAESLSTPITPCPTGNEIEKLSLAISDMAVRVNDAYVMQKGFSSAAAHELRTPLAALQTKLEVFLLKKERTKEEYAELMQSIGNNVSRLSDLVTQLLDLTNQGVSDLSQKVNLRTIADEAALDLQPLATQRKVEIIIEGECQVTGNDCLLQRAMFNLMQNAVKYNIDNGKVYVSMNMSADKSKITIADTGIGIDDEHKSKVFDLFYCIDKSRSRDLGGNGLGLAIVKRIIAQHNGTITVANNIPQGSVFEVEI